MTSLSEDFEITALSTSRRESADAASQLFGVSVAFDNHQDLVNSPAVDVVAVTVKVPYHLELATAALGAGKAVYCEWPLGNGLNEAEDLGRTGEETGRPRQGKGAQSSLEILPVAEQYRWSPQGPGPSTNVAQAYARFARDYREGTHCCPTFEDAVTRHRMLNAIETAAATGQRQTLG